MDYLAEMEKGYVSSRTPTVGVISWDMDQQYYPPFEYYANVKAVIWKEWRWFRCCNKLDNKKIKKEEISV